MLTPGKMPLWLAWIVGVVLVIAFWTLVEANVDPVPRALGDGFQLAAALLAMPVAWRRGRRWWLWGLMAGAPVALFLATRLYNPLLQPMFAAAAVLLAEPGPDRAANVNEAKEAAPGGEGAPSKAAEETHAAEQDEDAGDSLAGTPRPTPPRRRRRY